MYVICVCLHLMVSHMYWLHQYHAISYKKQELLTPQLLLLDVVRVSRLFCFLCLLCFVCLRLVSCLPNVTRVSGLCHRFSYRLFIIYWYQIVHTYYNKMKTNFELLCFRFFTTFGYNYNLTWSNLLQDMNHLADVFFIKTLTAH